MSNTLSFFHYRIWYDTDNGPGVEVERSYLAYSEGDAFRFVERDYPTWYSVELVHQRTVRTA